MPDYACIVQQGQEAERRRDALEQGLRRIARDCFGDDPAAVEFRWTAMPEGMAWTAGEPSRSSIVVRSVPVGFDEYISRPGRSREKEMAIMRVCVIKTRELGSRRVAAV